MASITIIGSGNTATAFARALFKSGHSIDTVISRNYTHATALASQVQAIAASNPGNGAIDCNSDLILICTGDDQITRIAEQLRFYNGIACHCSGSMDIRTLQTIKHHAVLYPLQTLSKERSISFRNIPLLYEGSDNHAETFIRTLAEALSLKAVYASSATRLYYHMAAVWANNFGNLMAGIAAHICRTNSLDFSLLKPLILETAEKLQTLDPAEAQTGPARRGDMLTMQKHIQLLEGNEELKDLYTELSRLIHKMYWNETDEN